MGEQRHGNRGTGLRRVPVDDRAWLMAALADALDGGPPVQPVAGPDTAAPESPLPPHTAVVIHTSGSSGVPKFVALSADALRASAHGTHEALGGAGQWLVALPTHLVAGVQMLVRSILAGSDPVFTRPGFDADDVFSQAARLTGDRRYVSLVPVQLARLLDEAHAERKRLRLLQRFDAILVGGQATPLDLRVRAHELGLAIQRTYGATETAGGVVYDGVAIGASRVRIRDGEVQLSGPTLALGYIGDAERTSAQFIHDGGERWYRTGDSGELLGGMLTVTGRLDRVIISGGVNASLDAVEDVARETPDWADVGAVGVTDAEWGQRSVLVVERSDAAHTAGRDADADAETRQRIRERLGAAAVPVRIVYVDQLPRLPSGKPDYETMKRMVDERV